MIDFFDRIYTKIENKNQFLTKIKYYGLLRFLIKITVNGLVPILFLLTKNNKKHYLLKTETKESPLVIVSLTSFPARIKRVWLVVETILRQTHKPDKIILWLSKEQFPALEILPPRLLDQQKRGLEIRLVDGDLKSHKKYYYTLHEFPDDIMITIDDDIFYRSKMIEDLYEYSCRFTKNVIAQYCKQMKWKENRLSPHITWPIKYEEIINSDNLFFGSGGGTLFPPHSFYPYVLNEELFISLTPTADDVWLNTMCKLNQTKVTQTIYHTDRLPVLNKEKMSLASVNNGRSQNDIQLNAVREYFIKKKSVDPYLSP